PLSSSSCELRSDCNITTLLHRSRTEPHAGGSEKRAATRACSVGQPISNREPNRTRIWTG
ncbi:unnamed protein product, partial [Scytosiphon promiscuus]